MLRRDATVATSSQRVTLLIGGGGLVGAHVRALLDGAPLVVTHRVRQAPGGVFLDITDGARTTALIREVDPRVIVLAAAEPYVERCELEPVATRAVNVEAARVIAAAARDRDCLLVVFSSEYVFDGTKGRYDEDDDPRPINEYGRQKVELEAIARTVPRHLICRTSGVYGWEETRKNFVCQIIDRLRTGHEFVVPSDQLITPTYAVDLARAVVTMIGRETTGTVHVVGPRILPRAAFALTVCERFDLPPELVVGRPTDALGLAAPRPRAAGLADDRLGAILRAPLRDPASALSEMRASEGIATPGR